MKSQSARATDSAVKMPQALAERPSGPLAQLSRPSPPRPVLQPIVIRFGRLGDMVMLTSVLQFLHHRFSSPCVVVGAGPWNSQLYVGHPDVAEALTFTRHFPFLLSFAWWRALWILRRSDPSPIYVFERKTRQLARIRRILKLSGVNPARCVFITDEPDCEAEHWIDLLVRFATRVPRAIDAADFPVPLLSRKGLPSLYVLQSERRDIESWLRARGWTGHKLVLIQPGNFRSMSKRREQWQSSAADDKSWPIERWNALLKKIGTELPGALIFLCGAPQEAAMLERIRVASGSASVLTASLPLRQLLALCELAHSMISVDTGPAHAAAALGVPLVVMYGRESPATWLPRSACGSPVVGIGGPPVSTRVDQIPVDDVFEKWRAMLATNTRTSLPAGSPVTRKSL